MQPLMAIRGVFNSSGKQHVQCIHFIMNNNGPMYTFHIYHAAAHVPSF